MKKSGYFLVYIILAMACKKPYTPPAIASTASYLVVEGVIKNGPDSTVIKLSRTVNLGSGIATNPASGAAVAVESDQNVDYPLIETSKGNYTAAGLNLDATRQYRIKIQVNNEQYLSDFVPVINAPPIDTVSHVIQSGGLQINVSTHDPKNNTRYYRWEYQETWIFHSNYFSGYKSNGDTVIERNIITDQIYQCWGNDTSSNIVLGSSAALSQDVISNNPIIFIPSTSEKLGTKYSILVKEYALTGDAYNFWVNLKKNTEQLGSIFDAQPSEINGNIHAVNNPSEPVIGYISAGSVTTKRIFITNSQLPAWVPTPAYPNCMLDSLYLFYSLPGGTVPVNQENEYFNINKGADPKDPLIPVQAIQVKPPGGFPPVVVGHSGSTRQCVDCTLRGTNVKPSFWQ